MFISYLVIIVSESAAELVVIHVGLVLAEPPEASHLLCIQQLELPICRRPGDGMALALVLQKVQQELPQCDGRVHGWRGVEGWRGGRWGQSQRDIIVLSQFTSLNRATHTDRWGRGGGGKGRKSCIGQEGHGGAEKLGLLPFVLN